MSGLSRVHSALHRTDTTMARAAAKMRLIGVTSLGARARTIGAPHIKNRGRIDIGDDFFVSSEPIISHIVVGRGGHVVIGNGVTIESGAAIACEAEIRIGDGVYIGRNVMMLDTDFHAASSMTSAGATAPIVIADGVRIEEGVIVLKGARIGKRARIGASSVVSGVIAADAFASGVPAAEEGSKGHGPAMGDDGERVRAVMTKTFGGSDVTWDSLGTLRLLLSLEEEFGVHLPEDALTGITSVDAIAAAIERAR